MMLEAGVALSTAVITGMAILTQKVHNRITQLERRVDGIALDMAQRYVTKYELSELVERVENHMMRIEDKLDRIVMTIPTSK